MDTNSLLVTSLAKFLPILEVEFPGSAAVFQAAFAAGESVILYM